MVQFVNRAGWGAAPAQPIRNRLAAKPLGVVVHWEGPKMGTVSHSRCPGIVKGIQRFHQQTRGWADIAYSLIVCQHGTVYEGRGKGKAQSAQGTTAGNVNYYSICALVGQGDPQSAALVEGVKYAANLARSWGAGTAVKGHRDFVATECPGANLYSHVRKGTFSRKTPAVVVKPIVDKIGQAVSRKPVLRRGSRSTAVLNLQKGLLRVFPAYAGPIRAGGGPITTFGPATERVVKEFQRRSRLSVTGVVEAKTWAALAKYGIKP